MYNEKVAVAYALHQLKCYEQNYLVHDLDLAAKMYIIM
jgi:hypothetical protein